MLLRCSDARGAVHLKASHARQQQGRPAAWPRGARAAAAGQQMHQFVEVAHELADAAAAVTLKVYAYLPWHSRSILDAIIH